MAASTSRESPHPLPAHSIDWETPELAPPLVKIALLGIVLAMSWSEAPCFHWQLTLEVGMHPISRFLRLRLDMRPLLEPLLRPWASSHVGLVRVAAVAEAAGAFGLVGALVEARAGSFSLSSPPLASTESS